MTTQKTSEDARARAVDRLRMLGDGTGRLRVLGRLGIRAELAGLGLWVPRHLAIDGTVSQSALAEELTDWADTLAVRADGNLRQAAREAAGLTPRQTANMLGKARRGWVDRTMGEIVEWLAIVEGPDCWPTPDDLEVLAKLYHARPEYLAGYPLAVPQSIADRLAEAHGVGVDDRAKVCELARMIGGYAVSAAWPVGAPTAGG